MKSTKTPQVSEHIEKEKSALELWKLMGGGKAQPVKASQAKGQDSMLAVYKDRLTYTFIMEREVASIHYDQSKEEIFFKGHNLKNMKLETAQIQALERLKTILMQDERSKHLVLQYEATLAKLLADNR